MQNKSLSSSASLIKLKQDFLSQIKSLKAPWSLTQRLFAILWMVAILLDAGSTLFMMRTGLTEEGNSAALFFMEKTSVEFHIFFASVICLLYAGLTLSKPTTWAGRALQGVGVIVLALKLYVGLTNVLLYLELTR